MTSHTTFIARCSTRICRTPIAGPPTAGSRRYFAPRALRRGGGPHWSPSTRYGAPPRTHLPTRRWWRRCRRPSGGPDSRLRKSPPTCSATPRRSPTWPPGIREAPGAEDSRPVSRRPRARRRAVDPRAHRRVTDRAVAGGLQSVMIRSLVNRADVDGSLAAIDRTTAIPGLPLPVRGQLDALRFWVRLLDGDLPTAAEGEALLSRSWRPPTTMRGPPARHPCLRRLPVRGCRKARNCSAPIVAGHRGAGHARAIDGTGLAGDVRTLPEWPAAGRAAVDRARRLAPSAERNGWIRFWVLSPAAPR